jgi:hypothetical protein
MKGRKMRHLLSIVPLFAFLLSVAVSSRAQEPDPAGKESVKEQAEQIVADTREKVEEIAQKVDESPEAQEASAGILKPIYSMAEYLSFSAFHWLAFAVMIAGVVGFALQLVLAKLVVLGKMGFSLKEFLSDALGLVISLLGLVLTTQAATENSNFTSSPAAVLSAAIVGVLVGLVFYWWGQTQEIEAVEGRKKRQSPEK